MTSLSVQDDNPSSSWLVLPTPNKIVKEAISFLTDKSSVDVERSSLGVASAPLRKATDRLGFFGDWLLPVSEEQTDYRQIQEQLYLGLEAAGSPSPV